MSDIVIYKTSEYEVWLGVDGDNIVNAHIIGSGPTRAIAVNKAVRYLESSLAKLRSPIGVVREVEIPFPRKGTR